MRALINQGEIVSLSGPAGVGKSLMALDAARSISGCQRYLGHFPTERGSVLVIDQESNPARLQGRLRDMQKGRSIPPRAPLRFIVTTGVHVDEDGLSRIDGWLRERAPVLLVIDSFVRFHRKDENSSRDMADVGNGLRRLVDRHGCGILLLDHVGKAADVAIENRLRGSGEKRALVAPAPGVAGAPLGRVTLYFCTLNEPSAR